MTPPPRVDRSACGGGGGPLRTSVCRPAPHPGSRSSTWTARRPGRASPRSSVPAGRSFAGGWLTLVRTPSGGMHAYYPADPDRPQPSWQAARAHVDFRGEGGYVVVPPSMVEVADDRRVPYAVIGGPHPAPVPVDAGALRDLLNPRPGPIHRPRGAVSSADAERLAAWVAARGEGERNRGLFWAACRLAEAGLSPVETQAALAPAAEHAGLPEREVAVTIRSAYRAAGVAGADTPAGPGGHDETPRRAARFDRQVLA